MENIFVEFLPPWVETGIQPAFYDKESGTVLQQTARMYARVNMLIRMFNKLSKNTREEIETFEHDVNETVEEYIGKFNDLYNYVHDYFDNLDVQEEINNKLDQMADDGELENIIALYINKKVEYIFPKFWASEVSQDCSLIRGYDKNICIDCGTSGNWSNIKSMFDDNEISHFDYFIVSHYDPDHIGNVNNMISYGYIDSDTVVYLPVVPDRFSSMQTVETTVKSALTANNISFSTPDEGDVLSINDDFDITFGNLDKAYMEDNYVVYNYTSMVCLVRHKDTLTFFSGDAGYPTYEYLDSIDFVKRNVDLFKEGHHGIDLPTDAKFLKEISPRYTVQEAGIDEFSKGYYQSAETAQLIALGSLFYATYMNSDYIKFESNGYCVVNTKGLVSSFSNGMATINLYVDANALITDIQDGSSQRPFKELNQALGYINGLAPSHVKIYMADGTYGTATGEIDEYTFINKHDITIEGSSSDATAVIIDNLTLFNSKVKFNYVTIKNSKTEVALRCTNSEVSMVNCVLDGTSSAYRGIVATGSELYFNHVTFKNCINAIALYENSTAVYDDITLESVTRLQEANKGSNQFVPVVITDSISETNRFDINYTFGDFSKMYVCVEDRNDHNKQNILIIDKPTNNDNYSISIPYAGQNNIDIDTVRLALRNNNTIFLANEHRYTFANNATAYTNTDITGTYKVSNVLGLMNY